MSRVMKNISIPAFIPKHRTADMNEVAAFQGRYKTVLAKKDRHLNPLAKNSRSGQLLDMEQLYLAMTGNAPKKS